MKSSHVWYQKKLVVWGQSFWAMSHFWVASAFCTLNLDGTERLMKILRVTASAQPCSKSLMAVVLDENESRIFRNIWASYGGFLKWGYPPIIIHFHGIFHEINHPFGDSPIDGNPQNEAKPWIWKSQNYRHLCGLENINGFRDPITGGTINQVYARAYPRISQTNMALHGYNAF